MPTPLRPLARTDNVLSEELGSELVLYDEQRDIACRLNRTAALVWKNADGSRTVADLVELLRQDLGEVANEDLVMIALDRLMDEGLIESGYEPRDLETATFSRRRFIRHAGVIGTAAVTLPVIQAIVAPTPSYALS